MKDLIKIFEWGNREHSHFAVTEIVYKEKVMITDVGDGYGNYYHTYKNDEYQHVTDSEIEYLVNQQGGGLTGDNFYGDLLIPIGDYYLFAEYST